MMTSDFASLIDEKPKASSAAAPNADTTVAQKQQQQHNGHHSHHQCHHSHSLSYSHGLPHSRSHARTLSLNQNNLSNNGHLSQQHQHQHHHPMLSPGMFATPSATISSVSSHHHTPNAAEHAEMIDRATMDLLTNAIATPTTPGENSHHQALSSITHADLVQASTQLNALQSTTAAMSHHNHHHQQQQQQQLVQSQPAHYLLAAAAAAAANGGSANNIAPSSQPKVTPDHSAAISSMPTPGSSTPNMTNGSHHHHSNSVGSVHTLTAFIPPGESTPDGSSTPSADQESNTPGGTKTQYKRFRNSFIFFVNEQRKIRMPSEKNIKNREFIQSMSEIWRSMSEDNKKPYIELANEDKERYDADVKAYGRIAVKKKTNKLSSPAIGSSATHPLTSPVGNNHGFIPPGTPNGMMGSSSVPVTPDWRQHQFTMNMMMNGGAAHQSTQLSPHHPYHHPQQQQQQRMTDGENGYPAYMLHPQLAFNMANGNGMISPQGMVMAHSIMHQNSPHRQNQHLHMHPNGHLHMNGIQSISMASGVPYTATAASAAAAAASPLGSPLHNPNGTLRKHIPGTKRKITPDGKPMTRLPTEIKRFRNSFIFFVNEQRKNKGVDGNSSASGARNREFIRDMSAKWHEMSEDERAPYIKLANEDKERYNREIAEWEEKHPGQGPKSKRKRLTVSVTDDQLVDSPMTAKIEGSGNLFVNSLRDNPISAPPILARDPSRPPPTPLESNSVDNYHQEIKTDENNGDEFITSNTTNPISIGLTTIAEQPNESTLAAASSSSSSTTNAYNDIKPTTVELGLSTSELISTFTQSAPIQGMYSDVSHAMHNGMVSSAVPMENGTAMTANNMSTLNQMMNISAAELSAMSSIAPTPAGQMSPPIQTPGALSNNPEHLDQIANAIEQANAIINSSNDLSQ